MMWREARTLSYLMHDFDDYHLPYKLMDNQSDDSITDTVVDFFYNESALLYPAKSYFVAIIYAKMVELYFDLPFYEALSQNDLLVEDKYFKPYNEAKNIYDNILKRVSIDFLRLPSTTATKKYFREEFLVGADC